MKQPIAVEVREGAAYVRYAEAPVARTQDVTETGSVAADVDDADNVLGIEILDVIDKTQLARASSFARQRGLAFPRDLSGVLVPA